MFLMTKELKELKKNYFTNQHHKFLVIGSNGFIGTYLISYLKKIGKVLTISRKKSDYNFDIQNVNKLKEIIMSFDPNTIIYLAGVIDIENAEKDKMYSTLINSTIINKLVKYIKKSTKLVYFSSIAVYPDIQGPHIESNVRPVNHYGKTKLEGERNCIKHENSIILRFSVIGESQISSRKTLTDLIIESLTKKKKINLFYNELFNPLNVMTLVEILILLIKNDLRGTYNLGSSKGISKSEFGYMLAKYHNLDDKIINSCSSLDNKTRIYRSADLRLNCSKIEKILDIHMPSIEEEINRL